MDGSLPRSVTCNPVTADMIDRLDERLTPDASSKLIWSARRLPESIRHDIIERTDGNSAVR